MISIKNNKLKINFNWLKNFGAWLSKDFGMNGAILTMCLAVASLLLINLCIEIKRDIENHPRNFSVKSIDVQSDGSLLVNVSFIQNDLQYYLTASKPDEFSSWNYDAKNCNLPSGTLLCWLDNNAQYPIPITKIHSVDNKPEIKWMLITLEEDYNSVKVIRKVVVKENNKWFWYPSMRCIDNTPMRARIGHAYDVWSVENTFNLKN